MCNLPWDFTILKTTRKFLKNLKKVLTFLALCHIINNADW